MLSERGIILETYIERESNRAGESATAEVQEVVSKLHAAVIHSCIDDGIQRPRRYSTHVAIRF